jgi:hypothetical protein
MKNIFQIFPNNLAHSWLTTANAVPFLGKISNDSIKLFLIFSYLNMARFKSNCNIKKNLKKY